MQALTVGAVVIDRLAYVALSKMRAQEQPVDTLAERIAAERAEQQVENLPVAAGIEQPLCKPLDRVQAKQSDPLPLGLEPVVVPIGKKSAGLVRLPEIDGIGLADAVEETASSREDVSHVDHDLVGEPDVRRRRVDDRAPRLAKPPERRPEVRARALLARVKPESSGHVDAEERPVVEGEESDEPLRPEGKRHGFLAVPQLEAVQESQTDVHSLAISKG
jgi:hypothetical protein